MVNPKELVFSKMLQMGLGDNPILKNLINLANSGKKVDVETIAKNLCKERGINFDEEFANFTKQFKK